jgi:hypothetical protein
MHGSGHQHSDIHQALHNLHPPPKRTGYVSGRYSMSSKEEVHVYFKAFFMGESACRTTWTVHCRTCYTLETKTNFMNKMLQELVGHLEEPYGTKFKIQMLRLLLYWPTCLSLTDV